MEMVLLVAEVLWQRLLILAVAQLDTKLSIIIGTALSGLEVTFAIVQGLPQYL